MHADLGESAEDATELAALLAADNEPPRVVLVARPGRCVPADLPGEPTPYSPYGIVLGSGSPADVPAVADGCAGVQDEGSQLVAIALVEAPLTGSDELWLDLCAGPGGKAALLAALAGQRGAALVANEAQPHRARLVRNSLSAQASRDGGAPVERTGEAPGHGTAPANDQPLITGPAGAWSAGADSSQAEVEMVPSVSDQPLITGRPGALVPRAEPLSQRVAASATQLWTGGSAGVVAADGRRPPFRAGAFDRVLVDAPCSGLGALRRRPEARWRRKPADIEDLVPLQRALLSSALDLVRPGGVVLYATCSPVLEETKGVVEAVLAERADVSLEPVEGTVLDVPDSQGPLPGTVQLWPHRHGTDAMFMALLRKA